MMDYRPNANTSLEEQMRRGQMFNTLNPNAAPSMDQMQGTTDHLIQQQPGQQHMISSSELSRLNLANIEARLAAQAARVQAAQQAQVHQSLQMIQESPGMPPKPRLVYPSSPMKASTVPMQFSPQNQPMTGGYHSPIKQRLPPFRQGSDFSFPSPASSFLSPTDHSILASPASFASSGFPTSAGSFNSVVAAVRSPAEGLNMLRAASLGMHGDRPEGLQTMLAPPLTGQMPPVQAGAQLHQPPPRHVSNSSMDDMSVTTLQQEGKLFIEEVREWDVLCGRGGKSNHHPGNKRYRHVVSEMKMMYRKTEAKAIKTDLSRAIVEHVCNYGGRFIKRDDTTGQYYVLTKAEARKKTSQALRETKELKWTA